MCNERRKLAIKVDGKVTFSFHLEMGKSKKYFCELCCGSFTREWSLRRHVARCQLRVAAIDEQQLDQNNESSDVDFDLEFLFHPPASSLQEEEEVASQQLDELDDILETAREGEAEFSRDFCKFFLLLRFSGFTFHLIFLF